MSGYRRIATVILLLILTSGCSNHALELNSTSTGKCYLDCKSAMQGRFCFNAVPIYNYITINGNITERKCECILEDCLS